MLAVVEPAAASGLPDAEAQAAPSLAQVDAIIQKEMAESHILGLSAAIVRDGKVLWSRGFGKADLARGTDVTPDTVFVIASSSKVVVATALMKAVEQGRLGLDQDVSEVLPFPVRNPRFADDAITPRLLATHSSSIVDNEVIYASALSYNYGGDHPTSLGDYVRDYLVPGSRNFNAARNFARKRPGHHREYSNVAVGLLGHVIESAVKQPFETYTHETIFAPLGMTSTGWHMKDVDMSRHAVPYLHMDGRYLAYQHFGIATYPDGGLRTTARDMARFLGMVMEGGSLGGRTILQPRSVATMLTRQGASLQSGVDAQGLIWRQSTSADGRYTYWWHTGGDPGTSSRIALDPEQRIGMVLLLNVEPTEAVITAMNRLQGRLFDAAMQIPAE